MSDVSNVRQVGSSQSVESHSAAAQVYPICFRSRQLSTQIPFPRHSSPATTRYSGVISDYVGSQSFRCQICWPTVTDNDPQQRCTSRPYRQNSWRLFFRSDPIAEGFFQWGSLQSNGGGNRQIRPICGQESQQQKGFHGSKPDLRSAALQWPLSAIKESRNTPTSEWIWDLTVAAPLLQPSAAVPSLLCLDLPHLKLLRL